MRVFNDSLKIFLHGLQLSYSVTLRIHMCNGLKSKLFMQTEQILTSYHQSPKVRIRQRGPAAEPIESS
jgi:hypothetical protein